MGKVSQVSEVLSDDGSVVSQVSEKSFDQVVTEVLENDETAENAETQDSDEEEEKLLLNYKMKIMAEIANKEKALAEKKHKKAEDAIKQKWVLKSEAHLTNLQDKYPVMEIKTKLNKQAQEEVEHFKTLYEELRQYYIDTEFKKWNDNKQAWESENGWNPKKQFTINPHHKSQQPVKKVAGPPKEKKEQAPRTHKHEALRGREQEEISNYDPEKCGVRKFNGEITPSQCQKPALAGWGICKGCQSRYLKSGWFKDGMIGVTGKGMFGSREDPFAVNHPWNEGDFQDIREQSLQDKVVCV